MTDFRERGLYASTIRVGINGWKRIRKREYTSLTFIIFYHKSLRKIPKFHLMSFCGNFVETVSAEFPQDFHIRKLMTRYNTIFIKILRFELNLDCFIIRYYIERFL